MHTLHDVVIADERGTVVIVLKLCCTLHEADETVAALDAIMPSHEAFEVEHGDKFVGDIIN